MNIYKIIDIVNKLGITFDKYNINDLIRGINIEKEHGPINPKTNVTYDDLETTMKIALAHLNEFPNYYNPTYGISFFESELKKH